MATILIVDDRETNRDFLATLLGHRQHRIVQAADGRGALALARVERPDLIISDILMPTMDGYELVRALRSEPAIAQTPVVFTTAHYLDREGRALAASCGVALILPLPCEPDLVLQVVDSALQRTPGPAPAPRDGVDREHLRLVNDELGRQTDELRVVNEKLTALIEASQQLALERDPQRLFQEFTRTARQIMGARFAVVARSDPRRGRGLEFFSHGFEASLSAESVSGEAAHVLTRLLDIPGTHRRHALASALPIDGLPRGHPSVRSLLAGSIVSLSRIYGWVCVSEKIGSASFTGEDERMLGILGAQLGRIYENGRLYVDLTLRTTELEQEVAAHRQAEAALSDRARLAALGADIGGALTRGGPLPAVLQACAAALVHHLDAASVYLWTLDADDDGILHMQARAGIATHFDRARNRLRVGELEIGSIAASRRPHVTDHVATDPFMGAGGWAQLDGTMAFAGYPLIVEDRLVGVMAMFTRAPLGEVVREALASTADEIALGIQRQHVERVVQQNERRFQSLMRNASDLVMVIDDRGVIRYASPSHERTFGYRADDLVGRSAFDNIHPDDLILIRAAFAVTTASARHSAALEYRQRHLDGSWRVLEGVSINLFDDPAVAGIVVNAWDVTTRKRAEERTAALLTVAQDVAGSLDLERILDRVQADTAAMLPCDAVGTFALDADTGVFSLIGQRGMSDGLLAVATSSDLRRGRIFEGLTRDGETAVINDFGSLSDAVRSLAQECGVAALVAAPLHAHDRYLGALVAMRTSSHLPFEPDQVELCVGIAKQLALAPQAVDLHRAQQKDAQVASGLATAGKELIAALGQPGLLARLCQVTRTVLQCDVSGTMLRQPDDTWVHVASAGWSDEERESVHAVVAPAVVMAPLVAQLEQQEMMQLSLADVPAHWVEIPRREGIETVICLPLRCAGRVIGVHTAGFRRSASDVTAVQRRIAEGLGTIASLALDNVRLIERLDRANRLKSDFVNTMSHELRTPLNIIIGYNDLLRTAEFGPLTAAQEDALNRVDRTAQELLGLVNATLDLSRLESRHAELELADVDLADLIGELQYDMRRATDKPDVRMYWPTLPPGTLVRTDRVKVKVLLKNLIDNAVKFTDTGRVDIGVQAGGPTVAFTVTDTGIGIPPDAVDIIFESFRQVEPSMTRRHDGVSLGLGLGLYVARRLTEMLGGTIAVQSEVGRGSTFRVEIPTTPPPWPAPSVS